MFIDGDILIRDMLAMWGDCQSTAVVELLARDHPGLTALFITQGLIEERLDAIDCNRLTNMLIDLRVKAFNNQEKSNVP